MRTRIDTDVLGLLRSEEIVAERKMRESKTEVEYNYYYGIWNEVRALIGKLVTF